MSGPREKKILKYSPDQMAAAVDAVRGGKMNLLQASKKFPIPRSTLRTKVEGISAMDAKMGASTIFTQDEENVLANWVLGLAKAGFPISKTNILHVVGELALEILILMKMKKFRIVQGESGTRCLLKDILKLLRVQLKI